MSYKSDLIYLNTVTDIKTRDQLNEFVEEDKNYFIYITATWCGPCKVTKPKVIEYLKQIKNKGGDFTFLLLDADKCRDIVRFFKVKAFPTSLCLIKNQVEDICVGGGDEDLAAFFNASYKKLR